MKKESYFKIIYWVLASIMVFFMLAGLGFAILGKRIDPKIPAFALLYFIIALLLALAIFVGISIFIYKDALKHGMDPWMWVVIAVFVPNLIGLIIYFIVRSNKKEEKVKCVQCGSPIDDEYKLCPYCGAELSLHCSNCGKKISLEWQICPYCSKKLKD